MLTRGFELTALSHAKSPRKRELLAWLGLVDMFQDKMQHFSVRVNVPATTNNGPLLEF
jgi:hypothetical protein